MTATNLEDILMDQIKEAISKPNMYSYRVCRLLNGKYKYYCKCHPCFDNARQRKSKNIMRKNDCKIQYGQVRSRLKKLAKTNQATIIRKRLADPKNHRGWDFFNCYVLAETIS